MRNLNLRTLGLVLNLPIDEGSGSIVRDRSGLKNDGVLSSTGSSWVTGNFQPFYNAALFDGVSGNIIIPYNLSLAPSTEITVECWVKFASLIGWKDVVHKGTGSAGLDYSLAMDNNYLLYFIAHTTVDVWSPKSIVAPTVGVWYHVVGTYKSGVGAQLYINGVAQGTAGAGSGTIHDSLTALGIGSIPDLSNFSNCAVEDVMIYNRCLEAWEVMDDFLSGPLAYTTLDSKSLMVEKWIESQILIMSQFDQWTSGICKRKQVVYGVVRTYQLDCLEQNLAWANSLVNYFEQKASASTAIWFASSIPVRAVGPNGVNVYVQGVDWTAENLGGQNIRKFTLTLQEA